MENETLFSEEDSPAGAGERLYTFVDPSVGGKVFHPVKAAVAFEASEGLQA